MKFETFHCRLGNVNTTIVMLEKIVITQLSLVAGTTNHDKMNCFSMDFTFVETFFTRSMSLGRTMPKNIKPPHPARLLYVKFRRILKLFLPDVLQLSGPSTLNLFS